MLSFLETLWANPLARKAIISAAVLLAISYGFRRWLVHHDDGVRQQTRVEVTAEIEQAKKAEWAAKEKAIAADAAAIQTARDNLTTEAVTLNQMRAAINGTLDRKLSEIRASREATNATAFNVPADQLDASLRAISAELARSPAR